MRPIWRPSSMIARTLLEHLCLLYAIRLGDPNAVAVIPHLDTCFTLQYKETEFGEVLNAPAVKLKHLADAMKLNFEPTDAMPVAAIKIGSCLTSHNENVLFLCRFVCVRVTSILQRILALARGLATPWWILHCERCDPAYVGVIRQNC